MPARKKLSLKQERILKYIGNFLDEHQFPPTVRDIQTGCEISSTSVVDYNLRILQREGCIRRLPDVSRGLELMEGPDRHAKPEFVRVPVLGNIAAGEPFHLPPSSSWQAEEIDNLELPSFLTKGKANVFALRVKGVSMIDAFIADGDIVLMEPVTQAESGDMVAAWLSDREEVTLKRFYFENGMVRLQPANSQMQPIMVPADKVAIRGRVLGVVRSM